MDWETGVPTEQHASNVFDIAGQPGFPIQMNNATQQSAPELGGGNNVFDTDFSADAATSLAEGVRRVPQDDVFSAGTGQGNAVPELTGATASSVPAAVPQSQPVKGACGAMDKAKKEIDERTAQMDAKIKQKEEQMRKAAQTYVKEESEKHKRRLEELRAKHREEQEVRAKVATSVKASSVWASVELMVDLSKTNKFSKNTEQMRNILKKLCVQKNK
ncbi:putative Clathrin light chain [Trypanosoma vivax]|uniref:Clathrin light chain n=1 Tax=Trypanosoma vivax (strain Y486) TaxID=1055687 RepID=G0U4L1_TRYVY|nr:hypothetical protein TRVL_02292 [Trypanosoma vivax]KAH8611411.1 putative Clathrin light chain [Trypanosoma vivax]CCC52375.1 conserved hypothetical protein [Trypanosoma vivax Y486]